MLLHSFTLFVIPILYMPQDGKHGGESSFTVNDSQTDCG